MVGRGPKLLRPRERLCSCSTGIGSEETPPLPLHEVEDKVPTLRSTGTEAVTCLFTVRDVSHSPRSVNDPPDEDRRPRLPLSVSTESLWIFVVTVEVPNAEVERRRATTTPDEARKGRVPGLLRHEGSSTSLSRGLQG